MRRAAALVLAPVIAALALAGCGSSSSSSSSAAASDTYKAVTVTGGLNQAPKVTIPKVKGTGDLYTKTLIQGSGATFTSTTAQAVLGNYVAYDWSGATSKEVGGSYGSGSQNVFTGNLLTGVKSALVGQKIGSRVLAVVPPKDGFGASAASAGIGASDTLVFVIDMNQLFSPSLTSKQTSNAGGALPTVTAPAAGSTSGPTITVNSKATPPKTLQVKVLAKGAGPVVQKGQTIVVQYTGLNWRTGRVFDTSWVPQRGLTSLPVSTGMISGWAKGLAGQTVGSRVLLVVPPADGYGSAGKSQAGIKGTDTLVFAVDILAAYS
jgi:FKBP-type peptidyl-prolyl cis-trans isomerase